MNLVFKDQTFSFELLRTLSYTPYGGADIGECLSTAYRIEEGSFESWYTEWYKTAERIHALAQDSMEQGNRISAREFYMRASNYYRTAEFFLHGVPSDPRILETWGKSRTTFRQAIRLMDTLVEQVEIVYEGGYLPAYFYRVDDLQRPTLLVHGGFDSTGEELYLEVAAAALQRGYNCITFEGPGQGAVIREQQIPFRNDWEKVVTPVVDYLLTRPEVDPQRIALVGISLGGYLAPRAAAFEHRLAACIANDGLFSNQFGEMGRKLHQGFTGDLNDPSYMKEFISLLMDKSTNVRWAIENGMFTFKADSINELMEKTEPFTLEGVADKIKCPTLVCEAEDDHFFAGQPQQLYDALTCPKTFMKFTAEEGAEEHCHFGALLLLNHRLFDWLDQTLHVKEENPFNETAVV
ncbi:alpha/beta hydrolase family protein [Paenibacillus radicis (ex Xue et al. 2023)]|uniref:Alpha/beta fold hydrolase n=1 Tax=Paenibacillus radicis (ex Xue et al. 2023) TaxID=2972489 RepID=A0ABT1YQP2_9BACL|nr:alpha/beta fold hydrolase [Paenibacillus radicis (ex Xue et al. 2023)]MCR8635491.1 alpha/beta fold hydrolase [Paenibacillus radicis (ex Xue et al. 2023)]